MYPVHIEINTETVFIDFLPGSYNMYITVDRDGYKENGKYKLPVTVQDAWGYGGIVVYVSMIGYVAYDLACPYCAGRGTKSPCEIDGIYAECPLCTERYDLGSGYALPQKGVSREAMRQMNIIPSGGKLIISQKQ